MADEKRRGLMVRKLAGEPGSGVHHLDHITGQPALYPLAGVVFTDAQGRREDLNRVPYPPQRLIRVPTDYVQREPWIEVVGPKPAIANGGPKANPTAIMHTFIQADELVLHMLDGDYRYKVTHQPGKYVGAEHVDGEAHVATDVAGDPNTHIDWFYDADLIEG